MQCLTINIELCDYPVQGMYVRFADMSAFTRLQPQSRRVPQTSDWTRSFSSIFASESELILNSTVLFLGFDDLTLLSAFLFKIRLRAIFSPTSFHYGGICRNGFIRVIPAFANNFNVFLFLFLLRSRSKNLLDGLSFLNFFDSWIRLLIFWLIKVIKF